MPTKIQICGVQIDNVYAGESLLIINTAISKKIPVSIVTPNTDHIINIAKDEEFKRVYDNAALVVADGMPLLWAAKFLGTPLKEKISGSDLFPRLCELATQKGYRLFFLGGREGSADKAAEVLRKKYPGIKIAGTYYPPYGFENDPQENAKIIKAIKETKPDILFVGVGSPKQEKWIYKYKDEYQVPVSIGIGVSFDFVSGMVKRAPVWMQKVGLEWFWRLIMEPGRLWKRYLVDDPVFFWLVLKQKMGWLRVEGNPETGGTHMSIRDALKAMTPESIKNLIRPIRDRFIKKYDAETSFWRNRFKDNNGRFDNAYYERLMLGMAEETTDDFLKGKIVADFGCGPCGSLVWAKSALLRIGIDVLADRYADEFTDCIVSHGMIYLKSTEKAIPLPSGFVDIMFTLNAIDHVDNFSTMCNEILRVLKPGGEFIGSFNLEEPASLCEPQQLNEKVIKENLLSKLEIQSYRVAEKGPKQHLDASLFIDGSLSYRSGREGYLWVRARKPS